MPLYQYPESQLCGRPVAVPEQLEELPVGPLPNRPSIEERLNVLEKGSLRILHRLPSRTVHPDLY